MPKLEQWSSPQNRLLATLPVKEYERLMGNFEVVELYYKQILQEAGTSIHHVYFPSSAIISLLSIVEGDGTVGVGVIGNEGMVGASILLGSRTMPSQAVVQTAGSAVRLSAELLKKEFRRSATMQDLLLPYAHALLAEGTQSAACHRYHTPQERLCKWLLLVHDRSPSNEVKITHDFLAQMLGTRRATVTEAAHNLQKRNLINYSRGRIHILNRQGLEAATCSCYRIIREQFSNLTYA